MTDSPLTHNDVSFDPARRRVEQEVADRVAAEHAAADMAHRDDLARDVARAWTAGRENASVWWQHDDYGIAAALDRLSAAYGEKP